MTANPRPLPSRRALCVAAASALLPSTARAEAPPQDHGRVNPPLPVPDLPLVRHDGVTTRWPALVEGRATAIQAMFTSCRAACLIEGATFARVQKLLLGQGGRDIQLLSLSVDPQNDTPEALRRWLSRFHAQPGWIAAAPRAGEVDRLRAFLGGGRNAGDNHSTQVHMVDRRGRLIWRTFELPDAAEVAAILRKM